MSGARVCCSPVLRMPAAGGTHDRHPARASCCASVQYRGRPGRAGERVGRLGRVRRAVQRRPSARIEHRMSLYAIMVCRRQRWLRNTGTGDTRGRTMRAGLHRFVGRRSAWSDRSARTRSDRSLATNAWEMRRRDAHHSNGDWQHQSGARERLLWMPAFFLRMDNILGGMCSATAGSELYCAWRLSLLDNRCQQPESSRKLAGVRA